MLKKSILYLITKSVWGGAARYVYDLALELSKQGLSVAVAAGGKNMLAQKIIGANIPYFEIKNLQKRINPFKDFLAGIEILKLFLKLKPDIIHANSSKAGGIVGAAAWFYKLLSGRKPLVVFTAHGWAFAEDKPSWQLALVKFFSKISALFYDKIICVSEYDRRLTLENKTAPARKLVTVHNGIDVDIKFLTREEARKKLLSSHFPLITSHFIVGTIAEWTKNKGILYLLEATRQIENFSGKRKIALVLIGGGENPDKKKILAFIKMHQLINVCLHENLEEAASYLKAFDVFVLPSVKEGLPYTILEAMAAGVPIVATYVGGVPELITDQKTGFLIARKSPTQIADTINYFSQHPEITEPVVRAAKQEVFEKFTLAKMLKATKSVYLKKQSPQI